MAYTTATIVQVDPPAQDGSEHVVVEFTGNAGEVRIQKDYTIDENTTTPIVRQWVFTVLAALNSRKSNQTLVAKDQVIPPLAPAAPTAQDLWLADAHRLVRMQALVNAGGMLASNTEFTALQTSVKNGYLAAYAGAL